MWLWLIYNDLCGWLCAMTMTNAIVEVAIQYNAKMANAMQSINWRNLLT